MVHLRRGCEIWSHSNDVCRRTSGVRVMNDVQCSPLGRFDPHRFVAFAELCAGAARSPGTGQGLNKIQDHNKRLSSHPLGGTGPMTVLACPLKMSGDSCAGHLTHAGRADDWRQLNPSEPFGTLGAGWAKQSGQGAPSTDRHNQWPPRAGGGAAAALSAVKGAQHATGGHTARPKAHI